VGLLEAFPSDGHEVFTPFDTPLYEACPFQDLQVLGHAVEADGERFGDVRDAEFSGFAQQIEDVTPRAV
jgi:hypothetical protein